MAPLRLYIFCGLALAVLSFNGTAQPLAGITANGDATPISIGAGDSLSIGVTLDPAGHAGEAADWWLVIQTPQAEWVYYRYPDQWVNVGPDWTRMLSSYQSPLAPVSDLPLGGPSHLASGGHNFYFGVDMVMNGVLDLERVHYDQVEVTVSPSESTRLDHGDLVYQGAFRLPDAFNWGARGMSYNPAGNGGAGSLFVTAFQGLMTSAGEACYEGVSGCRAWFAEVSIPGPTRSGDWQALPVAALLRQPTSFDGGLVASVDEAYTFVSAIQHVPRQGSQSGDKLYGGTNAWYPEGSFGDSSFPTIWFSDLDGSRPQGMLHVGSSSNPVFHGRRMGEYLFRVPQWYADTYLGGRVMVTGRARGTPLGSSSDVTAGGSQGPTLFVFRPSQSDAATGDLDALAVLYYRPFYPGCAGPDIGVGGQPVTCDLPGYSMCDEWTGADFVDNGSQRAILIAGHKGCTNCYYCGETAEDPECHATPRPGECTPRCGEGRGYHCGPYRRQILFYDVSELGQAAAGERTPWSVLPYEIWEPDEFYLGLQNGNVCADLGGMSYDRDGRRLFLVERGLGGYQSDNATVVHVWSAGSD